MIICDLPNSDEPKEILTPTLAVISSLKELKEKSETTLDMSSLEWINPFSAILLNNALAEKHECNIKLILPRKEKVSEYLRRIGFHSLHEKHNVTSVPIHSFKESPERVFNSISGLIDRYFPKILSSGNAIKYIISELCDNIDQHSKFTQASIMAQCYEKKGYVVVGVVDNGISIPSNFEEFGRGNIISDPEAILGAIKGHSTKLELGRGWGLQTTKDIVNKGFKGEFFVLSRGGFVVIEANDSKLYKLENHKFNGTAVYCKFKIPEERINIGPFIS